MTRKEFLRAVGISAAGLAAGGVPRLHGAGDEERRRRLTLLVQEYDRQGNHRTGTRPDTVSAQWLSTAMQAWRVSATLEPVPLDRVDPVSCFVQFRERRIEGVPLYDGAFTDASGVVGRLGLPDAGTEIALVESDAAVWPSIRRDGKQAALVLVTSGRRPGLTLQDAPDFASPFGPPVLQVTSEEGAWLRQQAEKQPDVRLVLEVRRAATQAFNLGARIRGRAPSLAPLVVSAPRSAWWRGTSERGGALAALLEVVREVSSARPVRDCVFLAATGHELGQAGLAAFLAKHPEAARAQAWLCLGPSLGASQEPVQYLASADGTLERTAESTLARGGLSPQTYTGLVPGEPMRVAAAGSRHIALFGLANPYVATAGDRWPDAVSIDALVRVTGAVVDLVLELGR